jgi:hypothetical protein
VDPRRNVAVSDDNRALLGEDGIPRDVVEVVVSVDDELDGQFGDHANFAEEGLSGGLVFECIDYCDAIVADDEASVGAGLTFGIVDGGVNAVAERLEGEGKGGVGLGRRRRLREYSGNAASKKER